MGWDAPHGIRQQVRDVVGETSADYLGSGRITLGHGRLRERPITLLTKELGYAGPHRDCRAFAAKLGMPPREWLKSHSQSHIDY